MSWFNKLKSGLNNTSSKLSSGIGDIFTKRKLDDASIDELQELLIMADLGVETASKITEEIRDAKFDKEVSADEVKKFLAAEVAKILSPVAKKIEIDSNKKPYVIMVVGVNGNGKTTSIGKLAKFYKEQGLKVEICAADTFRAAAVDQLKTWGERAGVTVYEGAPNQDPASVVYESIAKSKTSGADVLFVDTAGRLQNKANLMSELGKIKNVAAKLIPDAPHEVVLVLDATTGQNALSQVAEFKDKAGLTGLVVTKLDGTAKGGVVVAIADKFKLNIYAIGIGEAIDDMKPFDANEFASSLVGLPN